MVFVQNIAITSLELHALGSAVARGGAGGARAPPVFFLESKNRPVQNVKNKILSSNCLGSFQKTTCR